MHEAGKWSWETGSSYYGSWYCDTVTVEGVGKLDGMAAVDGVGLVHGSRIVGERYGDGR